MRISCLAQSLKGIWLRHRYLLILIGATLVMVVGILVAFLTMGSDIAFGGAIIGVPLSDEGMEYLQSGYAQRIGAVEKKKKVTAVRIALQVPNEEGILQTDYSGAVYALTLIANREADYFLLNEEALELFIPQNMFLDIGEMLSPKEREAMEDTLIKSLPVDEEGQPTVDEAFPVAINVSDLPFIQSCVTGDDPVYLCFIASAPHLDRLVDFWEYLKNWTPQQ